MRSWPAWRSDCRKSRVVSRMKLRSWTSIPLILVFLIGCGSEPKIVTVDLEVSELICDDGVRIFEGRVLSLQGIKSVAVNMAEQKATIGYSNDQLTQDQLHAHLMEFGFTIDGKQGNPAARRRLPACCFEENP